MAKTSGDWDVYLPKIAGALRSCKNCSTGFTPNMLMVGREVNQPVDLIFPINTGYQFYSKDQYLAELLRNIATAHETARNTLKTTQGILKRDYDLQILEHTYKVGDVVYVLDTATVKGKCCKLNPTWKGPGVDTEKLSAYIYRVKLRGEIICMNHDRLKLCKGRKLPNWIHKHLGKIPLDANDDSNKFCICRGCDTGSFMIQCDECRDWFHGSCVNITKDYAEKLACYLCPGCDS